EMEDKETNKRDKVPGDSSSGSLLDKIWNIDGKIIKEGKLRTAMRRVAKPGTYVESLDGSIRLVNESDSHMDDSYSIFGGADVGMKPTSDDGADSGATINKTNSTSFAA
ncbi:hypothetical protein Tco_0605615, partial [Tanacetum coccineum]